MTPAEQLTTDGETRQVGVKYDQGKLKPRLVMKDMPHALQAVVAVATYGANKYAEGGWLHVPNAVERYTDAMYRHLMEQNTTNTHDEESGLLHLAHAAWNVLAVLELRLRADTPPKKENIV